jgi:hypothetical protein
MTQAREAQALIEAILAAGGAQSDRLNEIGDQVALRVIDEYRLRGEPPRNLVDALCSLASSRDEADRRAAVTLIFTRLVERLSDGFDPDLAVLYDAVFSQIIDHQRRRPEGRPLDAALSRFGIGNEDDMRKRRQRLRETGPVPVTAPPRLVVTLSRVTIGADVAITSVILERIRSVWPATPVVLVGPRRVEDLFADDPGIRVLETPYPRHGSLTDRLLIWAQLLDALRIVTGEDTSNVLFVDPDSRLSQLGLLPMSEEDDACRVFESRSEGAGGSESLGALASRWAETVFPSNRKTTLSSLRLKAVHLERGRRAVARLREQGRRRVVSISFGVGGNPEKRSGEAFEIGLVEALIRDGHGVVLDRGVDSDLAASERVVTALRSQGVIVEDMNEEGPRGDQADGAGAIDILAWDGGVGGFSAMIGASDLYVGYDSAFQHIAARLGVPVLAIIERSPGPRFRARWRPWSQEPVRVIPGDSGQAGVSLEDQAGQAVRQLLAGDGEPEAPSY